MKYPNPENMLERLVSRLKRRGGGSFCTNSCAENIFGTAVLSSNPGAVKWDALGHLIMSEMERDGVTTDRQARMNAIFFMQYSGLNLIRISEDGYEKALAYLENHSCAPKK